jgi:hypothetical protein
MKESGPFPAVTDSRRWKVAFLLPDAHLKMEDQGRMTGPWNIILPDFINL